MEAWYNTTSSDRERARSLNKINNVFRINFKDLLRIWTQKEVRSCNEF